MSTTKEWAAVKRRIYFTLQFQELLRYSEKRIALIHLAFELFDPHVSRESNQMHKFSPKCAFFPLNLVCWNKDRRLNQFSRPKFEFDSAHVKYGF